MASTMMYITKDYLKNGGPIFKCKVPYKLEKSEQPSYCTQINVSPSLRLLPHRDLKSARSFKRCSTAERCFSRSLLLKRVQSAYGTVRVMRQFIDCEENNQGFDEECFNDAVISNGISRNLPSTLTSGSSSNQNPDTCIGLGGTSVPHYHSLSGLQHIPCRFGPIKTSKVQLTCSNIASSTSMCLYSKQPCTSTCLATANQKNFATNSLTTRNSSSNSLDSLLAPSTSQFTPTTGTITFSSRTKAYKQTASICQSTRPLGNIAAATGINRNVAGFPVFNSTSGAYSSSNLNDDCDVSTRSVPLMGNSLHVKASIETNLASTQSSKVTGVYSSSNASVIPSGWSQVQNSVAKSTLQRSGHVSKQSTQQISSTMKPIISSSLCNQSSVILTTSISNCQPVIPSTVEYSSKHVISDVSYGINSKNVAFPYTNPYLCSPSCLQSRLAEMASLENETVKWERTRQLRRKSRANRSQSNGLQSQTNQGE